MTVGVVTVYRANIDDMSLRDLLGATVKMMLIKSTYTPDYTNAGHSVLADVSSHEIAAGNGYTAGGFTLTADTVNQITNGWNYSSDNPTWNATGGSIPVWRYGVLVVVGSLWGKTSPLIAGFLGDTAPADVPATTAGNPLAIQAPAGGWFGVTQA